MQRISKHGTKYGAGSEHVWPEWARPPVICAGCGERVTLKQSFQQDTLHGTFHAPGCLPYRVHMIVDRNEEA